MLYSLLKSVFLQNQGAVKFSTPMCYPPIFYGGSLGDLWDNLGCLIRFLNMKGDNFWHPEDF